jgi:hypothetical protein
MAYEILNSAVITPYRLHALLRLIPRLQSPSRQDLYDLLQPEALTDDQKASKDVLMAALTMGLIVEQDSVIRLEVERDQVESVDAFRRLMQDRVLGVTSDLSNNYLFNIFCAWYAVQDERVLQYELKEFETQFNEQLYPDAEVRPFNTTKLNGWRQWAAFLGVGWLMKFGNREVVIPDPSVRLRPYLQQLLPPPGETIGFGLFMEELGLNCPELDGGELFLRCWSASRGAETRGNELSLMLSTALRAYHDLGDIELIRMADAGAIWQLYYTEGHPIREVSHIRRRSA